MKLTTRLSLGVLVISSTLFFGCISQPSFEIKPTTSEHLLYKATPVSTNKPYPTDVVESYSDALTSINMIPPEAFQKSVFNELSIKDQTNEMQPEKVSLSVNAPFDLSILNLEMEKQYLHSQFPLSWFGVTYRKKSSTTQLKPSPYTTQSAKPINSPYVAENGDLYNRDNDGDGRVESVYVKGYNRKDGTYVRSHYRAAPRK